MLDAIRKRLDTDNEEGFTLIELMVVVLIIGILIAIAIPTFLGAQDRARDRGAQSNLRNGITAGKTIATDNAGLLGSVTAATLNTAEPAITFEAATAAGFEPSAVGNVAVVGGTDASLRLYVESESGTWFGMQTTSAGAVTYCRGADVAAVDSAATCAAADWTA